jgi:hypothetical protein
LIQRHVLYLGEINDEQQVAWRRSIEIFDQGENGARHRGGFSLNVAKLIV